MWLYMHICINLLRLSDAITITTQDLRRSDLPVNRMPHYNILDIVRIGSDIPIRELEAFQTKATGSEDLLIVYHHGITYPPRIDRRVLGRNPSVSYVEHGGSFGATVKITPKNCVTVEVNWLLKLSNAVLYVNVVEPLVRLMLARRGFALLHSACLARKDAAILFSAPPDTGKTTTVLKCLERGWFSFLSDDMTIIGPDLKVHKFPKPFTISAHTYASMIGDEELRLKGIRKKTKLRIKSLVHSRMGRKVLRLIGELNVPILTLNALGQMVVRPPKVFVEDLVRGVTTQSQAEPVAICLLRKRGEKVTSARRGPVLEELLYNSEDAFGFPPYSDVFRNLEIGGKKVSEILADERELLARLVNKTACFYLHSDSRRWDLELNEVMDIMLKPAEGAVTPEIGQVPTAVKAELAALVRTGHE